MTATTDHHMEATGALRAWLVHFDLLETWVKAEALPTKRADFYKATILRMYVTARRREERSQRFQLSRTL